MRWVVALGLLLVAAGLSVAALLVPLDGWQGASALACEETLRPLRLRLESVGEGKLRLAVENPSTENASYWGASYTLEFWRESWLGRVSPRGSVVWNADFTRDYNGTPVPPQGRRVLETFQGPTEPGRYAAVWRMEGMCSVARYQVDG